MTIQTTFQQLQATSYTPLWAMDIIEAAALQHYAIDCPYCDGEAPLVGGGYLEGYFFVCEDQCHIHFTPTIRRY